MAKTTTPGKKRRATSEAEGSLAADPRPEPASARGWSSAQMLGVLCAGLAVGGFGGYSARGGSKATAAEATPAPAETVLGPRVDPSAAAPAPAAGADKFGRPPGDEHFGHDHPPGAQGAAPAPAPPAPGPDGKDSFGREPGNEHFGHNHQ